jgi:hypothetical protein
MGDDDSGDGSIAHDFKRKQGSTGRHKQMGKIHWPYMKTKQVLGKASVIRVYQLTGFSYY